MSVLVTGAAGQVGSHLVAELQRQGNEAVAFDRVALPDVRSVEGNLLDADAMTALLASERWDAVYHLAGVNALASPQDIERVNVTGTATLLRAVRARARRGMPVLIMSSSAVYGAASQNPITEDCPLVPAGPYGASKMAVEAMARTAASETGQRIFIARPFNIIGPGQHAPLLHVRVARQLSCIARGEQDAVITTGPLEDFRDFIDVRDVAKALTAIVGHGKPGEAYNICSDVAVRASELVEALIAQSGLRVEHRIDEGFRSANPIPFQRGSAEKLRQAADWAPQVSLARSVADTLAELGLASPAKTAEKMPDSRGTT